MMRIGLTFDEYVDLKLKPHAGADQAFHEAARMQTPRVSLQSSAIVPLRISKLFYPPKSVISTHKGGNRAAQLGKCKKPCWPIHGLPNAMAAPFWEPPLISWSGELAGV